MKMPRVTPLLLPVLLACLAATGCSRPDQSGGTAETGSAIENLFSASSATNQTRQQRLDQQRQLQEYQKELQQQRLDSYNTP